MDQNNLVCVNLLGEIYVPLHWAIRITGYKEISLYQWYAMLIVQGVQWSSLGRPCDQVDELFLGHLF